MLEFSVHKRKNISSLDSESFQLKRFQYFIYILDSVLDLAPDALRFRVTRVNNDLPTRLVFQFYEIRLSLINYKKQFFIFLEHIGCKFKFGLSSLWDCQIEQDLINEVSVGNIFV